MGSFRPAVIALIIALSVMTSGVAALQSVDSGQSVVDASAEAVGQVQKSLEGESNTVTKKGSVSASMSSVGGIACPSGTVLLAKYEFQDTDNDGVLDEPVFEQGDAGDVFEFNIIDDDGDGVTEFEWKTTGPLVTYVDSQDDGPTTKDYNEAFDPPVTPADGFIPVEPADKSYSNVHFCIDQFYQIDLIQGQPASTLTDSNLYSPQNRLARAAIASERGIVTHRGSQNFKQSECLTVRSDIQIDSANNETSVEVAVPGDAPASCDGAEFSLASYKLPQGETGFALPQELQNSRIITIGTDLNRGESTTITISLK